MRVLSTTSSRVFVQASHLLAITGPVLMGGCDPEFTLTGKITAPDGRAISGADVQIMCGGHASVSAKTDASGQVFSHGVGWRPGDCSVVISADGFEVYRAPLMDHCTRRPRHARDACLSVSVDSALARHGSSSTGSEAVDAGGT